MDTNATQVKVVYENQRYYGPIVGWGPSPLLEMPPWSNEQLHPIDLQMHELEECESWAVAVTPGTDGDGWMYSSRFRNMSNSRPGGRSTLRTSDFVRRRRWIYEGEGKTGGGGMAYFEQLPANSMSSMLLSQINGNRRYAAMKGLKAFIGLFADMLERRQLWEVLPWDPSAWLYIQRKHYTDMHDMQAENLANTINTWVEPLSPSNSSTPDSSFSSSHSTKPTQDVRHLLDRLQCAAVFSRAAYGYAMAAGHLSSVMNFAYVSTVHRAAHGFDAITGASDEANNEAACTLAGISKEDLLMAEWKSSTFRPCHYVAIDRSRQQIVISIRGTVQLADALTDLTAMPMVVSLAGTTGTVHEGLLSAATYVHCNTVHALQVAATECPSWPLLVTGHSLGAGVSVLLTMLLREKGGAPVSIQQSGISCVSLGTPAVMCQKFADLCVPFVTSCIYRSDNVPRLSYATVEKLLMELVDNSPMRRAAQEFFKSTHATFQSMSTMLNRNPIQQIFPMQEEQQFPQTPESFTNSFKSQIIGLEDIKDLASPEKETNHAAMVTYRSLNIRSSTSFQHTQINSQQSIEFQELKFNKEDEFVVVANDQDQLNQNSCNLSSFENSNRNSNDLIGNSNTKNSFEFDLGQDVRWLEFQQETNQNEDQQSIEVIFNYQFFENQECIISVEFQICSKTQRSSFFSPAPTLEAENSFTSANDQLSSGMVDAIFSTSPSSQICTNPNDHNSTFDTFLQYGIMKGKESGENPPPESLYPPGRVYWILPSNVPEEQELQEVQIMSQEREDSGLRSAGQRILSMSSTDLRQVKTSAEISTNHPELIGIQQQSSHYVHYAQHVEYGDDMSMASMDASALLSSVIDEDIDNIKPVSKVGKRDVEWLNQWLLNHQNDALELGDPPTPVVDSEPYPSPRSNFVGPLQSGGSFRGLHKRSRSLSDKLMDSFSQMKNGLARSISKSSQMWRDQYQKCQSRVQNGLVIAEVDRKCFDRLLLTTELVSDHLPDVYLEAIKSL